MSITRYVLVDRAGYEQDHEYDEREYSDAQNEAEHLGFAIIAREYEYSDSELVWTPDGRTDWPSPGMASVTLDEEEDDDDHD